ncbi:MAG TPA: FAD-binding protein, partial [Anaeromyxobacter sp.]
MSAPPAATALEADVLVIGGGMAGTIAALAARAAGARVVVVRRAPGATALSSGAVSVAPHR